MAAVLEFSTETKKQVSSAIDDALCYSRPLIGDETEKALRQIIRMSLRSREFGGREEPVSEWFERDLRGPHVSLDFVVRMVERVCCHDASFQPAGEIVYILSFHSKDHDNRSRFMFKVYGGQEVQNQSMVRSGGGGMIGFGADSRMQQEVGIAERLMPGVLQYSSETMASERRFLSEKEARLEAKATSLFDTLMKQVESYQRTITAYTDKEAAVREIEIAARGLEYEQKKKEKADEDSEALKKRIFEGLEKHGPALLMTALSMIQRRSGDALPPEFKEWFAEQKKTKKTAPKTSSKTNGANTASAESAKASSTNGHSSPTPVAESKVEAEVSDAEEVTETETEETADEADGEPSDLDKLRLNVTLSAAQFLSLVRARGRWDAVRAALSEEPLALWDALDEATSSEDVASDQKIEDVAKLALMFGAVAQSDPSVGVAILGTLDDFCRLSLVNLTKLLEEYHNALRASA